MPPISKGSIRRSRDLGIYAGMPSAAPRSAGYSTLARMPVIARFVFDVTGRAFPPELYDECLLERIAGYIAVYGAGEGARRFKEQLSREQLAVCRAIARNVARSGGI